MKALKLPQFNEDKDDLDAYLIRFERACTAFEVRQEHRLTQLARLLQGKALDVCQRLADDEVDNYDVLKALTEGGYPKWMIMIVMLMTLMMMISDADDK